MEEKKKILIIEDDTTLRLILKEALQKENDFEVWDAEDGATALEDIEKFSPDLALIDINIPKIDGLTLARIMEDKKLTDKTKILFLTNSSDISKIATASSIKGVLGYLIKSDWDISSIVEQIKTKLK
ncbi:MAG: response regulator [Candidatus Paceibacterota bacterium]|jgi:DNA-binding response OmpR family regulator|nr:response regulator [Candidatus Paceibacterota bacterium]